MKLCTCMGQMNVGKELPSYFVHFCHLKLKCVGRREANTTLTIRACNRMFGLLAGHNRNHAFYKQVIMLCHWFSDVSAVIARGISRLLVSIQQTTRLICHLVLVLDMVLCGVSLIQKFHTDFAEPISLNKKRILKTLNLKIKVSQLEYVTCTQ